MSSMAEAGRSVHLTVGASRKLGPRHQRSKTGECGEDKAAHVRRACCALVVRMGGTCFGGGERGTEFRS